MKPRTSHPGPGSPVRRWPLFLIAAPAAVSIWSGWVGLGGLCGFGVIHPLPGIMDALSINTAITLPVGVEAYGAYALGAWLSPAVPAAARKFARKSAIGALALGMAGQIIYHLLAAAHAARAPVPVVVLVSCIPVVSLGFGAALAHLLRVPATAEAADQSAPPDPVATEARAAAARALAATVAAGNPLSQNQLMTQFRLTRTEAAKVRQTVPSSMNGSDPDGDHGSDA
jgi:hypothetical protein